MDQPSLHHYRSITYLLGPLTPAEASLGLEPRWDWIPAEYLTDANLAINRSVIIIIIIHSFYIALFSALEQAHCAHWHVILNE